MKIVQVNHMLLDGGGREDHIYYLSKGLAERGHKVSIVTSDYTPTGSETIGNKVREIKGVSLKTLKGYPVNIPPGRIEIPDLMDYLLTSNNYDLIHAHGMGEQVALEAFYAAKIKGVPFVYTPHFHPYWVYEKLNAQKIWEVLQKTQTHMLIKHSDAVITFSELAKNDLLEYTKTKRTGNIHIIPNGIEDKFSDIKDTEVKKIFLKYGIPEADNYIVFLGDPTNPRKGALSAIQAFRQIKMVLPQSHMIIIGPWGNRLKTAASMRNLVQLLNKLSKSGSITITDYVSDFDKYAILTGSHLLISPTIYDSFGLALAEALYCKIPVVATKIGSIPYVVRNNVDGYLVNGADNIKGFANACLKILKDKNKAKEMGQAGRQRVIRKFLLDDSVAKTESLYKKILEKYKKQ